MKSHQSVLIFCPQDHRIYSLSSPYPNPEQDQYLYKPSLTDECLTCSEKPPVQAIPAVSLGHRFLTSHIFSLA